jgi:hypothetical protein
MFYAQLKINATVIFSTKITAFEYIYIKAKIGQQPTTDEKDLIYTLGFELFRLCNEAWHMLHAANIKGRSIT